jgi:trigger factor
MQVTETLNEGLRRELKIVVPASELDSRLRMRLEEIKDQVRIKGFRPGKVPVEHLRRLFGRSTMAEVLQTLLNETTRRTLQERGERAAVQPEIDLPEDEAEAEKVLSGKADLAYSMKYEVLPRIEPKSFKGVKIQRPVLSVTDADVDEEIRRFAEALRTFAPKDGPAETGDQVRVSYVGKIEGTPFPGGSDEDAVIRIGSNQFIPGFEEQLVGAKAGESRTIEVTFPADYAATQYAGKAATFDVNVKEVLAPGDVAMDDTLAQQVGVESMEKLREGVRRQLEIRYGELARQRAKRQVLDRLDEMHTFELPASMVEQEFQNIWRQITGDMQQEGRTFESEGTTEEAAREEYRKIAERRVRLGLVMAELGERNKIEVTEEEVQRALAAQLRQVPGQEQAYYDYYRKNPEALVALRAPIFEEKVVDFLLELADVENRPMTKEELLKEAEAD